MELERQFVPTFLQSALEIDEMSLTPLSNKREEISTYEEINSKFDGISYNKGSVSMKNVSQKK